MLASISSVSSVSNDGDSGVGVTQSRSGSVEVESRDSEWDFETRSSVEHAGEELETEGVSTGLADA